MTLKTKIAAAVAAIGLVSGGTYYTINRPGAAPLPAPTVPVVPTRSQRSLEGSDRRWIRHTY